MPHVGQNAGPLEELRVPAYCLPPVLSVVYGKPRKRKPDFLSPRGAEIKRNL